MIQVRTQNFMDILRKKKEEDYTTGTEDIDDFREAEEAADEGVIQDEKGGEGVSGKELAEDKKRKKQKLEAAKEARAKNIRLWKKLLEEFSKHGDIKNENMGEIVVEFSRSFLIPKKTSASKVMNFYRTLVPTGLDERPTAEPELLDLFYEKETAESARDLNTRIDTLNVTEGAELLGDLKLNELEEKEYNGKKSLDILRDFLDAVSAIRGSALRGNVMTRRKLDNLNRLLITGMKEVRTENVEANENNLDVLLESFRVIVISLSKVKRQLEKNVKKSIDGEDTNYDFYADVDFQRAREKTISILPEETTDRVDYLIDKVEEIYNTTVELIERLEDGQLKKKAEKNTRIMKNLVDTMIGDYEFPIENNKKRAIKIN